MVSDEEEKKSEQNVSDSRTESPSLQASEALDPLENEEASIIIASVSNLDGSSNYDDDQGNMPERIVSAEF